RRHIHRCGARSAGRKAVRWHPCGCATLGADQGQSCGSRQKMDHLTWRKARKSASSGNCVEVAYDHDGTATGMVRDSKSPDRGHLAAELDAWRAFLTDVK